MELQIALLLIGLIIVGVVVLTTYERARFSKRRLGPGAANPETNVSAVQERPTSSRRLDRNPPPPQEGKEKVLRADASVQGPALRTAEAVMFEQINDLEQTALMPLDLSLSLNDPEVVEIDPNTAQNMADDHIDLVITLPGKNSVTRNQALGIYKQNEYLLEKPRHIFGLGSRTGLWSNLERDTEHSAYRTIAVSIQLVDTKGPIDESELNTFAQMGLKLADALQRPTKFSIPFESVLDRARDLDEFCETCDVLASLNVSAIGPTGFSGRMIDDAARLVGLQFGAMNIYHRKNEQALGCQHLFSLANQFKPGEFDPEKLDRFRTKGLTLFMNVPCTYQPVRAFDQMVEVARVLSRRLEGRLEDNDHRPLTDQGLLVIRTQIERIAADMTSRGIVPGSTTAMRLFS